MINRKHKKLLVGYEIECFIINRKNLTHDDIRQKFRDLHSGIDVGSDGSLELDSDEEGNYYVNAYDSYSGYKNYDFAGRGIIPTGIEVRTPPLPANEAVKLLKKVLKLVAKYGFTNSSSGIHLNFSTQDANQKKNFNPVLFAGHKIWNEIVNKFDRADNEFCCNHADNYNLSSVRSMYENAAELLEDCQDKYSAVNLGYLENDNSGRIEIRAIGNKDYHLKINEIEKYTDRILNLFHKCSEKPAVEIEV